MAARIASILLSVVLLCSSFIGCTATSATRPDNQKAAAVEEKERTTIINYWASTESMALDLVYYKMCTDYEDANPDVKINLNMMTSNSDGILKKMEDAKKGMEPEADVVMLSLFALGDRAAAGEVIDLDGYVGKWEGQGDLSPSAIELGKYKGKIMGVGYYPSPELFAYRKDYFKEAGLDPAKPPKTWEELAAMAEKLTVRDASGKVTRAGFDIPSVSRHISHLEPFMRMNGARIVDPLTEEIDINGPAAVEAAEWMIALKNKNVSIPFSVQTYDVPFLKGNSAISQVKNMNITAMIKANPELKEKIGFMPVPSRVTTGAFCGYKTLSIMKQSKSQEAAWKFIEYIMSKEQMWNRYKAYGIVPVRKSLEKQFIDIDPEFHQKILEYIALGQGKPIVSFVAKFNAYAGDAWEKMYKGEKNPQNALQEVYDLQMKDMKK